MTYAALAQANGTAPEGWEPMGVQIFLVVAFWAMIVLAVATVVLLVRYRRSDEGEYWALGGLVTGAGAVTALCFTIVLALPFRPVYWQDYRVQGEVLDVSNVLLEDGGDLTRTPVVTLEGVDRPVVVDDPRVVKMQGQTITLRCDIGWRYRAQDVYGCHLYDTTGR